MNIFSIESFSKTHNYIQNIIYIYNAIYRSVWDGERSARANDAF